VEAPQLVDGEAPDQGRHESHERAQAESEHLPTGCRVRRRHRGDRAGAVLWVPHRAGRQDVVLEQLEDDAEPEAGRDVAKNRTGDGPRDERPRDHHLGQTDEIHAHQGTPYHERDEDLDGEDHVNSPIGPARAVGTSCAVTSTPRAASSRSLAASSSVRYTKRSRSFRPVRWWTPPTLNR